jgi:hypothetical protein
MNPLPFKSAAFAAMMAPISPQVPTPSEFVVDVEPAGMAAEHTLSGGPVIVVSELQP